MKLKMPELNTKQAITIALLIGLLYTGAYIYGQYRLTIERRDSIKKWCITNVANDNTGMAYYILKSAPKEPAQKPSHGVYDRFKQYEQHRFYEVDACIKYFGK